MREHFDNRRQKKTTKAIRDHWLTYLKDWYGGYFRLVEGTHVKRSVGTRGHSWNDLRLLTDAWDSSGEIEYELLTATSEYANEPNLYGVSLHNGEMKLDISRAFPKTREELYQFDVMMISDIPVGNFSEEQMQWVAELPSGNTLGEVVRGLAVSPEKKRAYTRCKNMIAVWDLEHLEMIIEIPNRTGMWGGWLDDGPTFVLDLSPDGESLIATDSLGSIYLYDVENGKNTVKKLRRPATELDWAPSRNTVLWFGEFFPSGKKLMTGAIGGEIDIWDVKAGVLETTISFEPNVPGQTMAAFAAAMTPDEKYLVVSFDEGSPLDHIRIWSFENQRWVSEFRGPRMSSFQFDRNGKSLIAAGRDGGLYQFQLINGRLTEGPVFLGLGSEARTLLFATDEQSVFVGLDSPEGEIVEVDLKSGEILWRSSPIGSSVTGLAWLSDKRFLALHASGILTIWEK